MPNPTGPTAAEGMSKRSFDDLEGPICDLALSASIAKQLICNKLMRPDRGTDYVSIGRHEAEVIEHALMQVEDRANALRGDFLATLEGSDTPASAPTQDAGKNHPADTLNAHMAGAVRSYGPSLADQVPSQMGRSVFHDDKGQPIGEAAKPVQLSASEINPAALAHLSLEHVSEIYDGTFCLSGVLAGLSSQPRFRPQEDGKRTPAGVVVFDLLELVNSIQDAAHEAVRAYVPATEEEANLRAGVIMFNAATSGEVTPSLVDLAAIIAPHATLQESDR